MTDAITQHLLDTMKAQHISAVELAARAGYDRKTLTDLKHGHHSTRVSTLRDLGAVLGLELVWRPVARGVDCVDRDDGQQSTNGAK
ncbi:helix-turn-helix domain-containing protein [Mesorhizobium sp. ESP7-2]|uniref:helix-turn-helix domain-containing protein n=1 Tax=Mesorhizobium sp. ESP7-2 TaxID=2876622 RepID=UPI001CCBAA84|nr:helix-turn-helix transcriptional regulator [Mesorhizobium sp. ESP7-2]MBZ9706093.1 helix-turn-helix domain-containing protein [Mesorhizobium sp. ESP7-2]